MILQILNIAGGAVLASEKLADIVGQKNVDTIKTKTAPYESRLGLLVLAFGLVGLLERLSIFHTGFYLGSSFPQALPLIAVGLIMAAPFLTRYAFLKTLIDSLRPHKEWIGFAAIACGLGSLLLGCIYPVCYPLPF